MFTHKNNQGPPIDLHPAHYWRQYIRMTNAVLPPCGLFWGQSPPPALCALTDVDAVTVDFVCICIWQISRYSIKQPLYL